MPRAQSHTAITAVMLAAEVCGMAGFAAFSALLPLFMTEWKLSDSDAGWISGIFYAGYLSAVPVLVSLTDRIPPRRVYLISCAIAALANFGFAFAADGFWEAMVFRALAGVGLAGTYMPGLKLLTDHVQGTGQSRMLAFYTSGFSVGSSISFLIAGAMADAANWHVAFLIGGVGPLAAALLITLFLPREDPRSHAPPDTHLLDFRPVLRSRQAIGFVLTYMVHNFELFVVRSWIVAYLLFSASLTPGGTEAFWSAAALAALFNIMGVPATIIGNEMAMRFGRHRVITLVMLASAATCVLMGLAPGWPFWIVVAVAALHSVLIIAESSAVTAGAVGAAPLGYRGATMAVHSCLGFAGSFSGPVVFGFALQFAGGSGTQDAWLAAFVLTGAVMLLGPLALRLARTPPTATP
ncbi:MAG: MFS transporter [Alphaproteobacteria bacterium]|nr:MFS transporter [Alphaproteobacteria bacterium]